MKKQVRVTIQLHSWKLKNIRRHSSNKVMLKPGTSDQWLIDRSSVLKPLIVNQSAYFSEYQSMNEKFVLLILMNFYPNKTSKYELYNFHIFWL